jgi:hypothetical protein
MKTSRLTFVVAVGLVVYVRLHLRPWFLGLSLCFHPLMH